MGGLDSGRRPQRRVVEDCLILDANELATTGCFRRGLFTRKEISMRIDSICVATAVLETDLRCEHYQPQTRLTMSPANQESFMQVIALRDITPTFGGIRWYFRSRDGERCQKLYLPLHASQFGTRAEYQLTYQTKQVSPANRDRMRAHRLREALPGAKHGHSHRDLAGCISGLTTRLSPGCERRMARLTTSGSLTSTNGRTSQAMLSARRRLVHAEGGLSAFERHAAWSAAIGLMHGQVRGGACPHRIIVDVEHFAQRFLVATS